MNKGKHLAVLNHLQTNGSISTWEAINLYKATMLSAIIFDLRKKYDITTVILQGSPEDENSGFAVYKYGGMKVDQT